MTNIRAWKDCMVCGGDGKQKVYNSQHDDFDLLPCPSCRDHFSAVDMAIKETEDRVLSVVARMNDTEEHCALTTLTGTSKDCLNKTCSGCREIKLQELVMTTRGDGA